jgi:2-keto-4-pentenoate hydratase/2-oxohepta-3-ene-1,7-dioic acid hydratase in catechol pathway
MVTSALILALMCGAASAAAEQHAARIIRFLDDAGVERLGSPADGDGVSELIEGDSIHGSRRLTGERATVARLLSPITSPPVIYCVGLNYPDHAHSVQNGTLPTSPIIFFKNRNAASGPGAVEIPPASTHPDYEAELVFVVSKTAKDVKAADALEYVLGYTVGNDISARCWQSKGGENASSSSSSSSSSTAIAYDSAAVRGEEATSTGIGGDFDKCVGNGGQWSFSKGFDTHAPMGPVFVTQSELGDGSGLSIQLTLNGALMQNDTTSNMIFGVREIVEFITTGTTVEAGTVVFTGTMGGVGDLRKPQVILQDGDDMAVSIEKIGELRNTVHRPKVAAYEASQAAAKAARRAEEASKTEAAAAAAVVAAAADRGGEVPRPATRLATRLVRFLDAAGVERLGSPVAGAAGQAELIEGDSIHGSRRLTGERATVARLLAPVKNPPAVYGIGLNYAEHARQANLSIPLAPVVFFKNRQSIAGTGDVVSIPAMSTIPDYEAELAIVTKGTCKDVSYDDALECVLGYTVANDVSARCLQDAKNGNHTVPVQHCLGNSGQWSFSKSFDTHCPLGPALVTTEELGDATGLLVQMRLNGQLMQNDTTTDMIFNVRKIIEFISIATTIEPGTVIVTGTPGGVGYTRTPPILLQDGDNMTVTIDKIGTITNIVSRK